MQCPRCSSALTPLSQYAQAACSHCGGVWLSAETLAKLLRAADETALQNAKMASHAARHHPNLEPAIHCPHCRSVMNRMEMPRTHVIIDRCSEHGTWFDRDELVHVAQAVAGSKRSKSQVPAAAAAVGAVAATAAIASNPQLQQQARAQTETFAEGALEVAVDVAADSAVIADAASLAIESGGDVLGGVFELLGGIFSAFD